MLAVADTPYLSDVAQSRTRVLDLSVIVPTLNEVGNIERLIGKLINALATFEWEVIFVDDGSSDGTAQLLTDLAQEDRRIRLIRRFGRRGLSSAVIEGALASTAPIVAVIDADMQHDERLLPRLAAAIEDGTCDLAVGSRYTRGGSVGDWSEGRAKISRIATRLSDFVVKVPLADPMSGFFALRRAAFVDAVPHLSGTGYKILLDVISSSPMPLRIAEFPYRFRPRERGESKLDAKVVLDFASFLFDKLSGRHVSLNIVLFVLIGMFGLVIHLGVLGLLLKVTILPFAGAAIVATAFVTTLNFILRNAFVHHDRRLRGTRLMSGLVGFYLVCAVGAVASVGIVDLLHAQCGWWLAAGAGAAISSVWSLAFGKQAKWRE